jgi:hypothetical protein
MKALKRDHHLGLEPVAHINHIPDKFLCHMRYEFAKHELAPGSFSPDFWNYFVQFPVLIWTCIIITEII